MSDTNILAVNEHLKALMTDKDNHLKGYRRAADADRAKIAECRAALKRVAAALVASSHSEKYVSEDDWNPDAHVEIVLTIADARAVYAALAKAEGKVTG